MSKKTIKIEDKSQKAGTPVMSPEEFKAWLADEKNIKGAKNNALEINTKMHGNWFTSEQFCKKFKLTKDQSLAQFQILNLFKLITTKLVNKGSQKYKILITDEHKLDFFLGQLNQLNIEKTVIEAEITKLEAKLG